MNGDYKNRVKWEVLPDTMLVGKANGKAQNNGLSLTN